MHNASAVVFAVMFLVGIACANLVKWSVLTRICWNPPLLISIVRKSMHRSSKGYDDVILTNGAL